MAAMNKKVQREKTNGCWEDDESFRIPKQHKPIYMNDLKLNKNAHRNVKEELKNISEIFSTGVTGTNYKDFYHCLLWYEESIKQLNYKRSNNMIQNIRLQQIEIKWKGNRKKKCYSLYLSQNMQKKLSFTSGDSVILVSQDTQEKFRAQIISIEGNYIFIHQLTPRRANVEANVERMIFDIDFRMSRYLFESMHSAVHNVFAKSQSTRIFPKKAGYIPQMTLSRSISSNPEQRLAVEHIVAGSSGTAPFLLHGPPGTGKTVTIVEAILQLVQNGNNRIMVCTESNMAADHVACALITYVDIFDTKYFLLRSNSESRDWKIMPPPLRKHSNGINRMTQEAVTIQELIKYRIVVSTSSHAASFAKKLENSLYGPHITHLFIDEAAQAMEPSILLPVCGVLKKNGSLVLAGDPFQLGPVLSSHNAKKIGLGLSLMERLIKTCPLYQSEDSDYIVMLKSNFRSNPDILAIPNELFYQGRLRMHATEDFISTRDILKLKPRSRAIVFHAVVSQEEKEKNNTSYFNSMELEMVEIYVECLLKKHNVKQEDIGIITPYNKQLSKIQSWLQDNYNNIEAGTVEAFQGKEKRIIIISTVRGNGSHTGRIEKQKAQLGFLCDEKRFNVALTRAKAKAIVIGNPHCLKNEFNWKIYINKCKQLGTYLEFDAVYIKENSLQTNVNDATHMLKRLNISEKPARSSKTVTLEHLRNANHLSNRRNDNESIARKGPETATREFLNNATQLSSGQSIHKSSARRGSDMNWIYVHESPTRENLESFDTLEYFDDYYESLTRRNYGTTKTKSSSNKCIIL